MLLVYVFLGVLGCMCLRCEAMPLPQHTYHTMNSNITKGSTCWKQKDMCCKSTITNQTAIVEAHCYILLYFMHWFSVWLFLCSLYKSAPLIRNALKCSVPVDEGLDVSLGEWLTTIIMHYFWMGVPRGQFATCHKMQPELCVVAPNNCMAWLHGSHE